MSYEIIVTYDREIIRKAIKYFWLRSYTLKNFIGDSCLLSLFAYQWISEDRSWLIGFIGMCVLVVLTIRLLSYFVPLKRGLSRFERMSPKTAVVNLTEDYFAVKSNLGSSEVPWQLIRKVWKFPECWMFFPVEAGHFSLPIAEFNEDARAFIISQVEKYSGKVV